MYCIVYELVLIVLYILYFFLSFGVLLHESGMKLFEHVFGAYIQGRPKNRGHFVLWYITLEILNRSLPNLAQIKVTSF